MGDDIRVDGPRRPYGTIGSSRSAARNARSVRRAPLRASRRRSRTCDAAPGWGPSGSATWRQHDRRTRRPFRPDALASAPAGDVSPCPGDAAGRHRLELPCLGRRHDLRRPRQGRTGLGHRRQRVHRPAHGLRAGDPRPRRRARGRLRERADAAGRQLLAHERGRGPGDGARQGAQPVGREGAHDRVRHRGDDARDADRARVHGSRQDREVRGPVPRRPRLRPDQRRAQRHERAGRRGEPRRAALGPGHPGRGRGDDHPGPLQQHRLPAPPVRARRRARSPRSSSSPSSATPRGSCPSRASTRRCGR